VSRQPLRGRRHVDSAYRISPAEWRMLGADRRCCDEEAAGHHDPAIMTICAVACGSSLAAQDTPALPTPQYTSAEMPRNGPRIGAFHRALGRLWHALLGRRSQTGSVSWARMRRLVARWLPGPRICHPYPDQRLALVTQGRSRMR
jgi:hypothetical protein